MYSYEEYSKQRELASYLVGSITGTLKWNDTISERDKKTLAKQLLWCYETAKVEIPNSVQKEIQEILSA